MNSRRASDVAARGHRVLPHTADVIVEAWGPDLATCVEEALSAVLGICFDPAAARKTSVHRFRLGPATDEDLLLDALDEVIYVLDTSHDAPIGAGVRAAAETDDGGPVLDVELALAASEEVESTGSGPKAISRSELQLESTPELVRCSFLVDV